MVSRRRGFNHTAGQILPLFLIAITVLGIFIVSIVHFSNVMHEKMRLQMQGDVTLLSACQLQARSLNAVALVNQAIDRSTQLSKSILASWAALALCASGCVVGVGCPCLALLEQYSSKAPDILKRLQQLANRLADLQDRIVAITPTLVATNSTAIAQKNKLATYALVSTTSKPRLFVHRLNNRRLGGLKTGGFWEMPGLMHLDIRFEEMQRLASTAERSLTSRLFYRSAKLKTASQAYVVGNDKTFDYSLLKAFWQARLENLSLAHDHVDLF